MSGAEAIEALSPEEVDTALRSKLQGMRSRVLRAAQGNLAHPYLVPGGYEEAWDWDSYFIALAVLDWEPAWPHIRGTVENFYDHMQDDGRVPRWLHPQNSFWDSAIIGEDFSRDLAKPFLAQMALAYTRAIGDARWYEPYLEKQRRFLERWRTDRMSPQGLHVWASGLESGGDNHPDVFGWPSYTVEGIDLAVFLIREYLASAIMGCACGAHTYFQHFLGIARFLLHQMEALLFDPITDSFSNRFRPAGSFIRIATQTRFYPFWLHSLLTLDVEHKRSILQRDLLNPATFWGPHGIRSTSKTDPIFNNSSGTAPSNWQGPVWVVGNYINLCGLVSCGLTDQAKQLATRVQRLLLRDLVKRGEMSECYHSENGTPLAVNGFLSWNLLGMQLLRTATEGCTSFMDLSVLSAV
jgi:glycogen debranching enzyme